MGAQETFPDASGELRLDERGSPLACHAPEPPPLLPHPQHSASPPQPGRAGGKPSFGARQQSLNRQASAAVVMGPSGPSATVATATRGGVARAPSVALLGAHTAGRRSLHRMGSNASAVAAAVMPRLGSLRHGTVVGAGAVAAAPPAPPPKNVFGRTGLGLALAVGSCMQRGEWTTQVSAADFLFLPFSSFFLWDPWRPAACQS